MVQPAAALLSVLSAQPVIPVVVIEDAAHAVPLARALVAGGLSAVEVTLRTAAALDAIGAIAAEVPEATIGAGTILRPADYDAAVAAGARFIVSPGFTRPLAAHVGDNTVPLLPGASSPSQIMDAIDCGYSVLKFFPAEQSGGAAYLKSLSSVFQEVKFCPTGGINAASATSYLALPNVVCIGGSWVTPADALNEGDWDRVTELARQAAAISA